MTLGLMSDPMTNSHYPMKPRVKFLFIQLYCTVEFENRLLLRHSYSVSQAVAEARVILIALV